MAIQDRIMSDLKEAMRAKDELARDTLRMLKSDLGAQAVKVGRDLDGAEELAVLQKAVKSRRDSIGEYRAAGREDAADREEREVAIIERYLPAQLSEDETRRVIGELADALGVSSKKDLGRLMKELKAKHGATVDMKLASRVAGQILE